MCPMARSVQQLQGHGQCLVCATIALHGISNVDTPQQCQEDCPGNASSESTTACCSGAVVSLAVINNNLQQTFAELHQQGALRRNNTCSVLFHPAARISGHQSLYSTAGVSTKTLPAGDRL